MMSSAKARPKNAEVERRVKRRLQRLHRKRCPPSPVVPSFVTLSELHRGHDIDMSSYAQPTCPTLLQENPFIMLSDSSALDEVLAEFQSQPDGSMVFQFLGRP